MGCAGGYLVFASAGTATLLAGVNSHILYGCTSALLFAIGCWTLFSEPDRAKGGRECCRHSIGAHFLAGVGCSALAAPCCLPVAIALGIQSAQHDAAFGATMMAAFGVGQILPLGAAAMLAKTKLRGRVSFSTSVSATVSGTLLTAVGALYGAAA